MPKNHRRTTTRLAVSLAIIGATGGALFAQDRAADVQPNLLAGPDVGEKSTDPSLVSRALGGEVQKLPAPPAIAALELLDLDDETAGVVGALLADRASIMDTLVLANIELLSQIETVMVVGKPVEKLNMLREGLKALGPVRKWGRLDRRIAEVLPREFRSAYRDHIDEYERTRYRTARESGELDNKFGYRLMRYWEDIGWEIERAAERVFADDDDGGAWLRKIAEKVGLNSDQQGEIQAMAERFYIDTKGRPSEAEQMEFIAKIRTVMTIEQRWKFTGMMLRGELEPDDGED